MKISKNKRAYAVMFALVLSVSAAALIHGCGISNYTSVKLDHVSVTSTSPAMTMAAGSKLQLKATAVYSDQSTKDVTSSAAWSSSNASITIDGAGLATAPTGSDATSTVSAAYSGMQGSAGLTIKSASISAIVVSSASSTIGQAVPTPFTAVGTFGTGSAAFSQDISSCATWSTSVPSVATVDSNGVVTGLSKGTTDITAAWGGMTSAPVTLNVTGMALVSIVIQDQGGGGVYTGAMDYFTATGTFSDGTNTTTEDLTKMVTWTSSAPSIATIDNTGMAMGVAAGSVTITATMGSVSAQTSLTVFVKVH